MNAQEIIHKYGVFIALGVIVMIVLAKKQSTTSAGKGQQLTYVPGGQSSSDSALALEQQKEQFALQQQQFAQQQNATNQDFATKQMQATQAFQQNLVASKYQNDLQIAQLTQSGALNLENAKDAAAYNLQQLKGQQDAQNQANQLAALQMQLSFQGKQDTTAAIANAIANAAKGILKPSSAGGGSGGGTGGGTPPISGRTLNPVDDSGMNPDPEWGTNQDIGLLNNIIGSAADSSSMVTNNTDWSQVAPASSIAPDTSTVDIPLSPTAYGYTDNGPGAPFSDQAQTTMVDTGNTFDNSGGDWSNYNGGDYTVPAYEEASF